MSTSFASPWLPFGAGPDDQLRLLCLPHAGTGASTYRAWGAGLPPEIAVCPVQLPGRESRHQEEPFTAVLPLVRSLAEDVDKVFDLPYAVLGHSLGALVAFELVREVQRRGRPAPLHLFVAGRQAPHLPASQPDLRDLPLPELAGALRELGGTPAEVLASPGLLEAFAPLLRADFTINETYQYHHGSPLPVPVTAFAAAADPRAGRDEVAGWRDHTSRSFQLVPLPGGHFAVLQQAQFVHGRIAATLGYSLAGQIR
jgi:medium-chain acyl-[acyl-carrier-protein] hydrolase